MKKEKIIAITMLSVLTLTLAGTINAYDANYTITDYMCSAPPVIDGQFTSDDEWIASAGVPFGTNGIFRNQWLFSTSVFENQLIETADNTTDAEDYWEICYDGTADSGAAPQAADFRVVVQGHGESATVTWYQGSGTGWTQITSPSSASFSQAQSLSTSALISEPHYMLELTIDKQSTELGGAQILDQRYAIRFAYNDAHEGGHGLQVWPPESSRDVPNGWGYVTYEQSANPNPDIPEGFGVGVVIGLSCLAVVAGTVLLRKKPLIQPVANL
jgi:hypothetical protein